MYDHFEQHEISATLYAAPWFLTLFASQYPIGFVSRIFGKRAAFMLMAAGGHATNKIANGRQTLALDNYERGQTLTFSAPFLAFFLKLCLTLTSLYFSPSPSSQNRRDLLVGT